jgi:hypothetical protein
MALQLERGVRAQAIDAFYSQEQDDESLRTHTTGTSTPRELRARVSSLAADKAGLEQQTESLRLRLRVSEERLQGASVDSGLRAQQERRGAEESLGRNALLKQHVNDLSLELTRQQAQAREERTLLTEQLRTMLDGLSQENADLRHTLRHHGITAMLKAPLDDKDGKGGRLASAASAASPDSPGAAASSPSLPGSYASSAEESAPAGVLQDEHEEGEDTEGCVVC